PDDLASRPRAFGEVPDATDAEHVHIVELGQSKVGADPELPVRIEFIIMVSADRPRARGKKELRSHPAKHMAKRQVVFKVIGTYGNTHGTDIGTPDTNDTTHRV